MRLWHCALAHSSMLAARVEPLEVFVGIERRHAARAGRSDGLAIDVIRDVARREDARHAGRRGVAFGAALAP